MFDRFDVCEAYYLFALHHHSGQGSATYALFATLARVGFKPSPFLRDRASLSANACEIYDSLVSGARSIRDRR
jgi:hypothetical protein